jgi:uncharacterized membrane protein
MIMETLFSTTLGMMLFLCFANLLLITLALPMITRQLKPNRWYGFRARKALSDERIWYEINAYAGWRQLGVGIINILTLVGLFFIPGLRGDLDLYTMISVLVCCTGIIWNNISSTNYLRTL